MSKPKKRKVTSGTNLTDAQRSANGWGRLSLRISNASLAKLDKLAGKRERAKLIESMIEREHAALTMPSAKGAPLRTPRNTPDSGNER